MNGNPSVYARVGLGRGGTWRVGLMRRSRRVGQVRFKEKVGPFRVGVKRRWDPLG